MPESVIFTPFSVPIPSISCFVVLGPEKTYGKYLRFQKLKSYLLKRMQYHQQNVVSSTECSIINRSSIKELVFENVQAFDIFVRFNYTKYSF